MIAEYIDHTNLKATATPGDIEKLCQEAIEHKFRAICINTVNIPVAVATLKNSAIQIATVIDFPLGASYIDIKLSDIDMAWALGADEIDVVWNLGAFKNGEYLKVLMELTKIMDISHNKIVKVIVEAPYLNKEECEQAFRIVADSGAQYINSSTRSFGDPQFLPIKLWSKCESDLKIKAAGGIKTYQQANEYINAGADIIGTSSGIEILSGEKDANSKLS